MILIRAALFDSKLGLRGLPGETRFKPAQRKTSGTFEPEVLSCLSVDETTGRSLFGRLIFLAFLLLFWWQCRTDIVGSSHVFQRRKIQKVTLSLLGKLAN